MQLDWLKDYIILTFETIDSTNSEALRIAHSSQEENLLIIAKKQTGGRGQKGRDWVSYDNNLHASILVVSDKELEKIPQLSFITSIAMQMTISNLATISKIPIDIKLKWPNDVLVNNKKVAGILLESLNIGSKNKIAIGFGVNIMQAPKELVNFPATSLFDSGLYVSSDSFLESFMNNFHNMYKLWKKEKDFSMFKTIWTKYAYNLGEKITINDGENSITGIFRSIDDNGAMRLETEDGNMHKLYSGDFR